jgi:hypothetical protein
VFWLPCNQLYHGNSSYHSDFIILGSSAHVCIITTRIRTGIKVGSNSASPGAGFGSGVVDMIRRGEIRPTVTLATSLRNEG